MMNGIVLKEWLKGKKVCETYCCILVLCVYMHTVNLKRNGKRMLRALCRQASVNKKFEDIQLAGDWNLVSNEAIERLGSHGLTIHDTTWGLL